MALIADNLFESWPNLFEDWPPNKDMLGTFYDPVTMSWRKTKPTPDDFVMLLHVKAQVAEVYDKIANELSVQDKNSLILAGGAIRDLVFNGKKGLNLTPNDWDFWLCNVRLDIGMLRKQLSWRFPMEPPKWEPTPQAMTDGSFDSYNGLANSYSVGKFLIAGLNINLMVTSAHAQHLVRTFDYDVNKVYYSPTHGLHLESLAEPLALNTMRLNRTVVADADFLLARGQRIAKRLKLDLIPDDVEYLIKSNPNNIPEENTVVFGYRVWDYNFTSKMLMGSNSHPWESKLLVAECNGNKNVARMHLTKQECGCGIYAFIGVPQAQYYDRARVVGLVTPYGILREKERGWQAEKAEIVQLWVISDLDAVTQDLYRLGGKPDAGLEALKDMQIELIKRYDVPVTIIRRDELTEQLHKATPLRAIEPPGYRWAPPRNPIVLKPKKNGKLI